MTKEAIYKALVASMDNSNIGDISNVMTKNYSNKNTDDDFNKIMCCLNNLTIDFPKTQHNISLGLYEDKFNQLKSEKAPYFFMFAKNKKKSCCKELSISNCDRICKYIHKNTANKRYTWKTEEKFNVGMLCDANIKVDVKSAEYTELSNLMFDLKRKEQTLQFQIDNEIKQMNESDAIRERISKYDVFYDLCEKVILRIFNGNRMVAAENLIDFEYLQRENCDAGKNILWNCFGDIILSNIKNNAKNPDVIGTRKMHYESRKNAITRKIEKRVVDKIKKKADEPISTVTIYKEELEWIDNLSYRKNCCNDRELLFILLVQQKKSNAGNVRVYTNAKSSLTCGRIDKWIGDGVSIAKKGIK